MISLIDTLDFDQLDKLIEGHYARKIKSHFQAYGVKYDFCRFYLLKTDMNEKGIVSQYNSTMVFCPFASCALDDEDISDLTLLIKMNKPSTIELPNTLWERLFPGIEDEYFSEERTEFKFYDTAKPPQLTVEEFPRLDDVYCILSESFPAIRDGYSLWLTDTSHRVRRGLSQVLLLNNCTTATIQYIIDNKALIGHVATKAEERGKHYARQLLYWIGERLSADGLDVLLFARKHRVSYYTEIGFEPVGEDIVFERKCLDAE